MFEEQPKIESAFFVVVITDRGSLYDRLRLFHVRGASLHGRWRSDHRRSAELQDSVRHGRPGEIQCDAAQG